MKARRRRNFFFLVVTIIDDPPRSGVWPGVGGTLPERSSAFKTHSVTGTPFRPEKRIRNGVPDSSGTKKALLIECGTPSLYMNFILKINSTLYINPSLLINDTLIKLNN